MKVSEFIEWLKTQDQDAIVECLVHTGGTGYYDQGGNVVVEDFTSEVLYETVGKHFEYTNFAGNPYVRPDKAWYGKKYLLIGSRD